MKETPILHQEIRIQEHQCISKRSHQKLCCHCNFFQLFSSLQFTIWWQSMWTTTTWLTRSCGKPFPDAGGPWAFPIAALGPDQGHPTPSLQYNTNWEPFPPKNMERRLKKEPINQTKDLINERQQIHLTITLTREQKACVYVCTWVMHRLCGRQNEETCRWKDHPVNPFFGVGR